MKKVLLALASTIIVSSSSSAVVACGFKEPVNVILELSNNIARPGSDILKAYREIVDAYNKERPDNPIRVEVRETPANNIDNEIATGQPLPNLYVAYGDAVAKYETILNQIDDRDKIVDMAQVINWDFDYANGIDENQEPQIKFIKDFKENAKIGNELTNSKPLDVITHIQEDDPDYEKKHFIPLRDSFPREGSNNQKMYVAPTAKSGMNGIMNIRLINELVNLVTDGTVNLKEKFPEIRDPFFFKNGAVDWKKVNDVPLKDLTGKWHLPISNIFKESSSNISQLFSGWFTSVQEIQDLQVIMQDLSKLEVIVLAYVKLVESSSNRSHFKSDFSVAFDDLPGLLYTMQAALGFGSQQLYSWSNEKPYTLDLYESGNNARALKDVIELFAWADELRPLDNDSGNNPDHGYGGISARLNTGAYYSNTFQKQGMLAYFGSTAGAGFWINESNNQDTQVEDLELMAVPSYQSEGSPTQSFVAQQGPGMGMFKSKNQVKNEIAIDFVNYFLRAENNAKFAFAAGYIPSNHYAYYNQKDATGVPSDENQMGPYYQVLDQEAENNPENPKIKAAKIVKKYVDSILIDQTQLWTQIPTPFGDGVRFQILNPWFEANFKTIQPHALDFNQFWKDLNNQSSIASAWRLVHGIFPVEGEFKVKNGSTKV